MDKRSKTWYKKENSLLFHHLLIIAKQQIIKCLNALIWPSLAWRLACIHATCITCMFQCGNNRDLKQRRRQRQGKRHLKIGFALFKTITNCSCSNLFSLSHVTGLNLLERLLRSNDEGKTTVQLAVYVLHKTI